MKVLLLILSCLPLVAGVQNIHIPNSDLVIKLWTETTSDGNTDHYYVISNTTGKQLTPMGQPVKTDYNLKLRYGKFDPLTRVPEVNTILRSDQQMSVYIVQFQTQPLEIYKKQLIEMGAQVHFYLASHSYLVVMNPDVKKRVEALPYVRWIGPYHPAYRMEEFMIEHLNDADTAYPHLTYNIMLFHSSRVIKADVAKRIEKLGGTVQRSHAGKYLMEATLTPAQLFEVIRWNEVMFVDRWGTYEKDMNLAREQGGANYIETIAGFTGEGVRGEVFDAGFNITHVDFESNPLIEHTPIISDSHGASTSGIVFGDGTGNPEARGLLPDGQGIVAVYTDVFTGQPRYDHTAELVQEPYNAVFQTSSVGNPRTTEYSTLSADTDARLFDFDIVHCQSQSNAGTRDSRPEAWAKNIISGGGIKHNGTLDRSDDSWTGGASIGPATDGRIKPDLCAYYDGILTTTTGSTTSYTTSFGGTSGATPIIAGHVGLFFDMWSDGIFGNNVDPNGTVFENRCHMATAKAMMINTAQPYDFEGEDHDLTRVHQGWGFPDLQKMYDMREKFVIIDETDILGNMQAVQYTLAVLPGEPELKITLVYADPPGNPSSTIHRVNDLTLKVTSPNNDIYWGNYGLLEGNWSVAGGQANHVDTVENVWIENPAEGAWVVEVLAEEINQDSHLETPELDADFALVAHGAQLGAGFMVKSNTTMIDTCVVPSIDIPIEIIQILDYTEEVTMSLENAPPGLTASFGGPCPGNYDGNYVVDDLDYRILRSHWAETGAATYDLVVDNSINILDLFEHETLQGQCPINTSFEPPAQLTMTLRGLQDVEPGTYVVDVTGTSVDMVRFERTTLIISNMVPPHVTALTPANGAIGIDLFPTISWNPSEQASSYHFQLASDPGFNNVIGELTTTGTSYDAETRLNPLSPYYWRVLASNGCGDQGYSSTFTFTTADQPDYMTEDFTDGDPNDLHNKQITAEPDGSIDFYRFCGYNDVTSLPSDTSGATVHNLGDDAHVEVALTTPIEFYGVSYSSVFIASNGFITFGSGDDDYSESLAEHFELPRISGVYDDLNPNNGGTISSQEFSDRFVVTFEEVSEYGSSSSNVTFQIELFHNGNISVTWLEIGPSDGISGFSQGQGIPADYMESDISAKVGCDP
ncbi:MAG: hypothetical protein CSA81_05260 [Acidobacteria bacterium]|nr:MAG: hypothetical protein CSA81_05260 [Acidobacteriota bacterium]